MAAVPPAVREAEEKTGLTVTLAALGFANVGGKASIPGPIPKSANLIGARLFLQAANGDAKANTRGLAASNPLALRIGNK